jgi:hypothetical protein
MSSINELTDGLPFAAAMTAFDAATDSVQGGVLAMVPVRGLIVRVQYTPSANITADPTNFRTLTVQNKGVSGLSGVVPVASRVWSAGNSVLSVPDILTLNATVANRQVQAGDVLQIAGTHGGTGLVIPAGSWVFFVAPHV